MANIAGTTKQFGLSVESTAALTTAFAKMGYDAEKAGMLVMQMLPRLGVVATQISKTTTDAARRIGIIPATLRKMMRENPAQALIYVLEKIKAIPLHLQAGALNAIFGQRVQADAAQLASQVDIVKSTFAELADKTKIAGAMQRDFLVSKSKMKLFKNSLEELSVTIGDVVLPAFTKVVRSLTEVFQKVTDFSKENPKVLEQVVKGTSLILGLAAGVTVLKIAFFGVGSAIKAIGVVFHGLLLAAQLHPVILAITAVTIGATLVIKYWTWVKEFFENFWEWISEKFNIVSDFFESVGNKVGSFFKNLWPWSHDNNFVVRNTFKNKKPIETNVDARNKTLFADMQLKSPANQTIANSNNKTLTNNMTFNINSATDSKSIADEIRKAVLQTTRDALYDVSFYVG
jgi:phage-related tail protein